MNLIYKKYKFGIKHFIFKLLYISFVLFYTTLTGVGQLHAISNNDISDIINGNSYFDSESSDRDCNAAVASVEVAGNDNAKIEFDYYVRKGLSREQAAGLAGNYYAESGNKPDITNKIGAFGIAQWLGGRRASLKAFAIQLSKPDNDHQVQLDYSWSELLGDDRSALANLKKQTTPESAALSVMNYYERPSDQEKIDSKAKRVSAAIKFFGLYAATAPVQGSDTSTITTGTDSPCGSNGAVAGNIAQTAINLAWDDKGHNGTAETIAKPSYVSARKQYNPNSGNDYSDCGAFVATVMRASGADLDFPGINTREQLPYLKTSGKYETFDNINKVDDLRPGDILIYNSADQSQGHVYLYVGPNNGIGNARGASLGTHVPQATNAYFVDERSGTHFIVARLK